MPYYHRDPRRAHNFDNHSYAPGSRGRVGSLRFEGSGLRAQGYLGICRGRWENGEENGKYFMVQGGKVSTHSRI